MSIYVNMNWFITKPHKQESAGLLMLLLDRVCCGFPATMCYYHTSPEKRKTFACTCTCSMRLRNSSLYRTALFCIQKWQIFSPRDWYKNSFLLIVIINYVGRMWLHVVGFPQKQNGHPIECTMCQTLVSSRIHIATCTPWPVSAYCRPSCLQGL